MAEQVDLDNIEIGVKVTGTIYLHTDDPEFPMGFNVDKIDLVVENIEDEYGGSIIYYIEDELVEMSTRQVLEKYKVMENKEKIEESIKKLKYYKKEALDKINSLLE